MDRSKSYFGENVIGLVGVVSEQGSGSTQVSDTRTWVDVGPCTRQDVLEETQFCRSGMMNSVCVFCLCMHCLICNVGCCKCHE